MANFGNGSLQLHFHFLNHINFNSGSWHFLLVFSYANPCYFFAMENFASFYFSSRQILLNLLPCQKIKHVAMQTFAFLCKFYCLSLPTYPNNVATTIFTFFWGNMTVFWSSNFALPMEKLMTLSPCYFLTWQN